jgi:hypothetical protein
METVGKLSVILATTLSATNGSEFHKFIEQCSDSPCQSMEALIGQREIVGPFAIAFVAWLAAAAQLVFRSAKRVEGIRSCLFALARLWAGLLIVWHVRERAQAYVFALHYTVSVLYSWRAPRHALAYPGLQATCACLGASAVGLFAWQAGVPIGLAAWYGQANCGWRVHLTACLAVDALRWLAGLRKHE